MRKSDLDRRTFLYQDEREIGKEKNKNAQNDRVVHRFMCHGQEHATMIFSGFSLSACKQSGSLKSED